MHLLSSAFLRSLVKIFEGMDALWNVLCDVTQGRIAIGGGIHLLSSTFHSRVVKIFEGRGVRMWYAM